MLLVLFDKVVVMLLYHTQSNFTGLETYCLEENHIKAFPGMVIIFTFTRNVFAADTMVFPCNAIKKLFFQEMIKYGFW